MNQHADNKARYTVQIASSIYAEPSQNCEDGKINFDCIMIQLLCRIQKYSDVLQSQILFPFFSWTKSSDTIWLRIYVYYYFFLSK